MRTHLSFLSNDDKKKIHQAALAILETHGMEILHDEALGILRDAGCRVDDKGIVKIPQDLVEQTMESCPQNIAMYDREGHHAMDIGGTRSYFGTGSDLMYTYDAGKNKRHRSGLEDVCRAARLCDGLSNIDFIMSSAYPSEIDAQRAYLVSFKAMVENSVKPIVCTAECRDDLKEMWNIACILRGSEAELRAKPYFVCYAEPVSPLKHPYDSLDKLLFCAQKGIPVTYSPGPIAGATAPITIAGHVAQGLAEGFCGLVIHQLKAKGAPFLLGMAPAVLDMATSQCSYNAPEYYLSYIAIVEMSNYYNIPNWGYAGHSDSQIPDGQATLESGIITYLAALNGSNLNHDIGYLDFGLTGSLEMIVITDEIISQVKRMLEGIPVNEETLGLDALNDVGIGGEFLTHAHTLKHLRSTQWVPNILYRNDFDNWKRTGKNSLLDRANHRVREILDSHLPPILSDSKQRAIQKIVDRYKN